jgi:DNA-binding MarR family transcriptional regulator
MIRSHEVLIALRRIIRVTDSSSKNLARDTGLTTSQLLVLQLLEPGGDMTIGDIAKQVNLSQGTVTIIIDRLEDRKLVARIKGQQDKRKVFVEITNGGRDMLADAPKLLQTTFLENFARLAEWEQTYMLAALDRVAHLMNASFIDASPVLDIGAVDRSAEKQKPKPSTPK